MIENQGKNRICQIELDEKSLFFISLKQELTNISNTDYSSCEMTLYEGVDHGSWYNAFAEQNFLKWIYSKSKK